MSNPVEEFLSEVNPAPEEQEKTAFEFAPFRAAIQKGVQSGVGTAAAAGVVAGLGFAANHVREALTKSRDFKSMLHANPDVAEHHAQNPARANQFYSSLRTMNPAFARDPIVAGSFMRQMLENPAHAGGLLAGQAVPHRERFGGHSPIQQGMMAAGKTIASQYPGPRPGSIGPRHEMGERDPHRLR